jgi:hypothetical protein
MAYGSRGFMNEVDDLSFTREVAFSAAAFVLLLLLLGAAAAIGETAVRAIAPKSDPVKLGVKFERSPRQYGLRPSVRSIQTGVLVETNSLGFREREYPLKRIPGVRRVAVIGDSYTFGVGVEFLDTYSKRLEEQLNRSWGPTEVINFGVSGYNTVTELATFRETAAQFRPDLVIVGYVLNDAERLGTGDNAQVERKTPSRLNAAHLQLKDSSMLYRYLSPKLGAVLGLFNARYAVGGTNQIIRSFDDHSLGWMESRQALVELAGEAKKIGAPMLVVVFPMILDFTTYPLGPAHHKITQFCKDNGIDVLDLLSRFEREKAADLVVFLDGHPNSRAHKIFADEIFVYLSRNPRRWKADNDQAAGASF